MEKKDIKKIKCWDIENVESAIKLYKEMKYAYLELRLSSRQNAIKNYTSTKYILKKNMARILTFLALEIPLNQFKDEMLKYQPIMEKGEENV